jgi:capsular polysaccharide biosynthesis protein
MNGVVAPATMQLGRIGGGTVPTGVVETMEEAAETSGGRCVTARQPETIVRPAFLGRPKNMAPLEPATDTVIPRVACAELPGGRVLGRSRALITGHNDLVWELSHYFGCKKPRQHPVFSNPFPGQPVEVAGRLGLLASRGDSNYYHFLIDVLPRLGILEQTEGVETPEQWYVPSQASFQRELLDMMKVPLDRRIDSDEVPHVAGEMLVVPGLASVVKEKNPPWVVEFLRARLMADVVPSSVRRPVYISRTAGTNNRAVLNEDELVAMLQRREFDVVDPSELSVRAQIETFASASLIVSAHGAALANLVFATPGAGVVELFPPGAVLPDYWRLAHSAGLEYRFLSTWPPRGRRDRGRAIVSDIDVDLRTLEELLDELAS